VGSTLHVGKGGLLQRNPILIKGHGSSAVLLPIVGTLACGSTLHVSKGGLLLRNPVLIKGHGSSAALLPTVGTLTCGLHNTSFALGVRRCLYNKWRPNMIDGEKINEEQI